MANAIVKTQTSILDMVISPISKLTTIWSPEVHIHGIPWKIEARKNEKENSLAVYLRCAKTDNSSDWTVPASATIQLLSFSQSKSAYVRHVAPFVFSSSASLFAYTSFITWDELMNDENKYVESDTIQLKIEIMAEDPNYVDRSILMFETIDKSCDCSSRATYRLTVTNVINLMAVRSPQFNLRRLPWELSVYKHQTSNLGIMLLSKNSSKKVSFKMIVSVKLIPSKDDVNSIKRSKTGQIQWLGNLKVINIATWDELVNPENGFINNGSIILEVKIKADKLKSDALDRSHLNPNSSAKRSRLECSICLEIIGSQDISATPCCHLFCTACITAAVQNSYVCPLCKVAVQLNDLRRMSFWAEN